MSYPRGGVPVWFGRGQQQDAQYLQAWRDAPRTYAGDEATGAGWSADRYEVILGKDATGKLFQRAAELTLHNRFYPREVMAAVSDFSLEGRAVRSGDRLLQRIPVLEYEGQPVLEMLTLNEISEVIQEPRIAGFTYVTTTAHNEVGEWSPRVEWRENNEVALVIEVVSRPRPGSPVFIQEFTRQMQLRGHKLSIQNFMAQLRGEPPAAPQPFARALPKLAPALVLVIAILVLIGASVTGLGSRGE